MIPGSTERRTSEGQKHHEGMALAEHYTGSVGQGVERNGVHNAGARPETGLRARSEIGPSTTTASNTSSRTRVVGKLLERGGRRFRVCGVTYGPFAPNHSSEPFPAPERVADDFARMRAIGINSVRTYHLPPEWFFRLADEHAMAVYVDVPWAKHVCFLDSAAARRDSRQAVREAAERGRAHACVLAYGIGNEVPPNIVRWLGTRRIERFLAELGDVARQADPSGLISYANYPSTEYLDLPFLDFATFNVYLHDRQTFRRYLLRLQNLVGDKPLLLGELGMDSMRHGEAEQADFLAGHLREVTLTGLAGAFTFSWTDEWFTGGHPIENWAFGITHRDRFPKASYHALREVFELSPVTFLPESPRVSVVVCTFNGGRTLEQCLRSLLALDYPDYEVIVVDDGSTDDTASILSRFSSVQVITQSNRGLSVARNVGLRAATGPIIAYTDSDCFAESQWLTQMVYQLQCTGAAAVGGPNLTPEDGWLASCVAASPGQPSHVLESDQVAEHIPGCNMAFRREALEAINGFDPRYRAAGDDVDVCWRLQQAGFWITFAPGAFVWHHRRQTLRAYLRQQVGYGEAEALLQFKHPHKFNGRGDGKWRGVLYGTCFQGLRLGRAIIYRGTFGSGLFQCLYQQRPAHWVMLPSTLEWHVGAVLVGMTGFFWPPAWILATVMLVLSLAVAALQGAQARLPPSHEGLLSRLLIAGLCYTQPLVRSWRRYRTRLLEHSPPRLSSSSSKINGRRLPLKGSLKLAYWSEDGCERAELLGVYIAYLLEQHWGTTIDSGWSDWDLEVHCHPWTLARIYTAQEDHGGGKQLIRVRYQLHFSPFAKSLSALVLGAGLIATGLHPAYGGAVAVLLIGSLLGAWWRGASLAGLTASGLNGLASSLGLISCDSEERKGSAW
jgi:GT2 family glycosyltransferase